MEQHSAVKEVIEWAFERCVAGEEPEDPSTVYKATFLTGIVDESFPEL